MDNKGQAALEYLMTYGWALIVIAIVVGVLVFIVTTPTDIITCSSGQPSKINVVSHNFGDVASFVADPDLGDMVITNVAGGQISTVTIAGDGLLFANNTTYNGDGTDVLPVGNTTIAMDVAAAGEYSNGTIYIGYTDPAGLDQNTSISCQGAPIAVGP